MSLGSHTIRPAHGARTTTKRLGRGDASGKGKTGGRGTKGQRARSGGRSGTARRAFKKTLQRMKKLRGFNTLATKPAGVTLAMLERTFSAGAKITPYILAEKGLVPTGTSQVKILATGTITKALTFSGCVASKTAVAQIEKAGGSLQF